MAGTIYQCDPADIGAESVERQLGKQAILGAGYGMGPTKFQTTCEGYGIPVDASLAEKAIYAYRDAYPEIPRFWYALENAAKSAITKPGKEFVVGKVFYKVMDGFLLCRLPSGRTLHYANPRIATVEGKWGSKEVIQYDAVHPMTKKWGPEVTWGGKLAENVTQATCADLIMDAMMRLEKEGHPVVLSVHDELVCEVLDVELPTAMREVPEIMCEAPAWADGFPIKAEVKSGKRYGK
jgi:DNA polymerase